MYLLTKATNLCRGEVHTGDDVIQLQKVLQTFTDIQYAATQLNNPQDLPSRVEQQLDITEMAIVLTSSQGASSTRAVYDFVSKLSTHKSLGWACH